MRRPSVLAALALCVNTLAVSAAESAKFDYRVLATTKTSTMEKELNDAAEAGYSFSSVMGGESAFGGKEVIVVMAKRAEGQPAKKRYKLVATSKTSTMEKELNQAGTEGFDYRAQTVFESAFGGAETAVILEYSPETASRRIEYRLVATSKTSTMQKELSETGQAGFEFLGMVVGKTAFGGKEVISILRKYVQ